MRSTQSRIESGDDLSYLRLKWIGVEPQIPLRAQIALAVFLGIWSLGIWRSAPGPHGRVSTQRTWARSFSRLWKARPKSRLMAERSYSNGGP